jgi:hypothetical protein
MEQKDVDVAVPPLWHRWWHHDTPSFGVLASNQHVLHVWHV